VALKQPSAPSDAPRRATLRAEQSLAPLTLVEAAGEAGAAAGGVAAAGPLLRAAGADRRECRSFPSGSPSRLLRISGAVVPCRHPWLAGDACGVSRDGTRAAACSLPSLLRSSNSPRQQGTHGQTSASSNTGACIRHSLHGDARRSVAAGLYRPCGLCCIQRQTIRPGCPLQLVLPCGQCCRQRQKTVLADPCSWCCIVGEASQCSIGSAPAARCSWHTRLVERLS